MSIENQQITNEVISDIQKEILKRNEERDNVPKRGEISEIRNPDNDDKFYFNFLGAGPRVEIHGKTENIYNVKFYNRITGECLKEHLNVKSGEWVAADQEYFVPWVIQTELLNTETPDIKSYAIELEGKEVFISYESSALGDTIAWMPVVEEFRKTYKCKVIVSSFHNDLFKDVYPNILFVERGIPLQGMQFNFKLGWFGSGHASNRNPYDCQTRNLQQIAMDILGLDYEKIGELRPKLKDSVSPRKIKPKYVVITTCSTAAFKYWNYPQGFQIIVDYLIRKGYQVVNVGKQPNVLNNVINGCGELPMDDLINVIQHAEFSLMLPSGLSWLSWSLGKKTIMITGISKHFCEFQQDIYRVQNLAEGICNGCFSDPSTIFDKGQWLFCKNHFGTPRHFECTKTITPEMVKKSIALVEKHIKEKVSTYLDKEGNLCIKKA